jgi:MoxR-like ATPase
MADRFTSVDDVVERLRAVDYLADPNIAGVVYLADRLEKPVLVEGPAGVGKTELAKALAQVTGARLIRLQCYEGLDESKALYEWNYKKQLLRIQSDREHETSWADVEADIFSEPFLVVMTSNNTRELSEALKRRCLYLHLDYPDLEREKDIVRVRVPDVDDELAEQVARVVRSIRQLELKKAPSISETIDWAKTLLYLGKNEIDPELIGETLHVLLKYQSDITKARKELQVDGGPLPARTP